MDIKYTILVTNEEGKLVNIGYKADRDHALSMARILMEGENPNRLTDIVIHPVIEK